MSEFHFSTGPGEQMFEDDDGTLVRIGAVPENVKETLRKMGRSLAPMPELVDGVIHYPDGSTKPLDDAESQGSDELAANAGPPASGTRMSRFLRRVGVAR